jgi:uncharacterized membrane protein
MAGMNTPVVYWIVQIWAALLMIGLSIPFIKGRIPPNAVAGFRTAKTMSDPEIWYRANRVMGWDLLWAGVAMLAGLVLTWFLRNQVSFERIVFFNLAVVMISITALVAHGLWKLSQIGKS